MGGGVYEVGVRDHGRGHAHRRAVECHDQDLRVCIPCPRVVQVISDEGLIPELAGADVGVGSASGGHIGAAFGQRMRKLRGKTLQARRR